MHVYHTRSIHCPPWDINSASGPKERSGNFQIAIAMIHANETFKSYPLPDRQKNGGDLENSDTKIICQVKVILPFLQKTKGTLNYSSGF